MNDQSEKRRIGILGGMGPEATVLLMSRIIAMTDASDDCDHVPMIVDNNTQIPSRIKAILEQIGDDPAPVLVDMARRLEANGAEALAMPCNTAHYYVSAIKSGVDIPLLNMVELSAERVAAMDLINRCVGLLASPAVRATAVYDQVFSRLQIKTIYPQDQDQMLNAIRLVKVDSDNTDARKIMETASRELVEGGADVLLVACSELSIIANTIPDSFVRLDAIDVLADAIIEFARAKRRGEDRGAT